jgi:hypothetical protein
VHQEAHPAHNPAPAALGVVVLSDGRGVHIPAPQSRHVAVQTVHLPLADHRTRVVVIVCNRTAALLKPQANHPIGAQDVCVQFVSTATGNWIVCFQSTIIIIIIIIIITTTTTIDPIEGRTFSSVPFCQDTRNSRSSC